MLSATGRIVMFRLPGGTVVTAKAGYVTACVVAALTLVTSGIAHGVVSGLGGIGGSNVLSGGPQSGPMNILLMGLESRTDYDGNILPSNLLTAMHAGSVQGVKNGVGGQDTNTLILIHIFDGGQKAVGFSVPRNDYVNFPKTYDGQSSGMVDQAYGLAYDQSLSQTVNSGMSSNQRYLQANEAGQAAAIATVESVTGQKVDHFAEANLAGFFELAQAFGGVEVCLKSWNGGQNLHDANSGFKQRSAGYHFLAADQALAFVRERDNLPNGDLDRTRRQQAVLDYVIWKLEHEGILSSFGKLTQLMGTAKQYLITDQGWNLLDFASDMRALTGKNLSFETLPIKGYATIYPGGTAEDVNTIDVADIQAEVRNAFSPSASPSGGAQPKQAAKPKPATPSYPASDTVVDVYNAGQPAGTAGTVMSGLTGKGYTQGQSGNATAQSATGVLYGSGAATAANAAKIAAMFGVKAQPSSSVSAETVEVILGSAGSPPSSLTGGSSSSSSSSSSSGAPGAQAVLPSDASSIQSALKNNGTNTPLQVAGSAPFGIPCVY
jgi:LCP family protein required for cell wall assembly